MYGDYELKHLAEAFETMVKQGTLKGVAPTMEEKADESPDESRVDENYLDDGAKLGKALRQKVLPKGVDTALERATKPFKRAVGGMFGRAESVEDAEMYQGKAKNDPKMVEKGHEARKPEAPAEPKPKSGKMPPKLLAYFKMKGAKREALEKADRLDVLADGLETLQKFSASVAESKMYGWKTPGKKMHKK